MVRVLLVDDHEIIRTGMKLMLRDAENIEVVGEASNGEEGIRLTRELTPDIVIMDINMPGIGGLEAIIRISRNTPPPKIIVVSSYTNDIIPSRLISIGVSGYLTKQADKSILLTSIEKVLAGGRYIEPTIMDKVVITEEGEEPDPDNILEVREDQMFGLLNERELQVLLMVARGMEASEISKKLYITNKTVNGYRNAIIKKFGVKTDVEAAKIAIDRGLIDVDTEWH